MTKIGLFIAGVQKSGTTALAEFLSKHPDIERAEQKELHVFDAPEYSQDFLDKVLTGSYKTKKPIKCDATPYYVYDEMSLRRMYAHNPKAKVIILLRNPLERAVSHYNMEKKRGDETLPLGLALLFEPFRLGSDFGRRHHSYVDRGRYKKQIERLLDYFPNSLVLRSEDLRDDHEDTMRRVCEYLSVEYSAFSKSEAVFAGDTKPPGLLARFILHVKLGSEEKYRQSL